MMLRTILLSSILLAGTNGFAFVPANKKCSRTTQLQMGLFDGVKNAFSQPAMERSTLDAERETPIDRWMGWSVNKDNEQVEAGSGVAADFVDAMDETNYVAVQLAKPMGIVFEENDSETGGIYVQSLKEDGSAAKCGVLQEGDQLISVNTMQVAGLPFDDALGAIVDSEGEMTKLVLFRGSAKQFYGPTGANREWVGEFVAKGGVPVSSS